AQRGRVLAAVKAWPGSIGARRQQTATASLDRVSTRGQRQGMGRDEETGFQVEQRNRTYSCAGVTRKDHHETAPGVVPLPPGLPEPKRTTDVLRKPDNSKSYRQIRAPSPGAPSPFPAIGH